MSIFSKALVLFWAAILMVSSTCFGADIHYCKGEAQSFAIFDTAKPCNMHKKKVEKKVRKCCMAATKLQQEPVRGFPVLKNGKCCYNDQVSYKSDVVSAQSSIGIIALSQSQAVISTVAYPSINWVELTTTTPPCKGPPDRQFVYDYQVFYQVFRI